VAGAGPAPPSPRGERLPRIGAPALLLATALGAVALGVRATGLARAFELSSDEMLYADLGASLSRGEMPQLADGRFFLHPPGFFLIEAAVIRLFGLDTGDSMSLVYDLRWLTAVLGAISVALAFLLLRRVAGTWPAVWGALVLAFEPFVLRNNSRVFLESAGGAAVLAGLLLLVHEMPGDHRRVRYNGNICERWPGRSGARLFLAGLLLGYSVFTKDVFVFCAVIPLLLAVLWRRTLPRRNAVLVLLGTAVPYSCYLVVLWSTGYLGEWTRAKWLGVLRLVGVQQSTGFNAPEAPSLVGRLIDHLTQYGVSYLLLALCPLAGVLASSSRRPDRRLIGLTAVVMGGLGIYLALFGTFEEHFGYAVMLAGVAALAVCAAGFSERRWVSKRPIVALLAAFLAVTAVLGIRLETSSDDGFRAFRAWAATNLPASARVGVTSGTAEWAFENDPRFGTWPTARLLEENGAQYVLTESLPTREGYNSARPALLDWLTGNATPLFRQPGPTNGETVLWFIDAPALERAAAADVGGPSPAGGIDIVPNEPLRGR
jgi:4-amino-4-deoxy-L-arabinose transferase-like glycosyltransferase